MSGTGASPDPVLSERRGGVCLLTLNRPQRLNAWNDELETRYFEHLRDADADPDVKAIVVTGAGRGFCAGADMENLSQVHNGPPDTAEIEAVVRNRPAPRGFPMTVRKPLIAAINGAAAGLGLVEALYCDIRFAVPAAKLTTAFVRRGLIAEYGIAWLLPRVVGTGVAMDLLLSGRVIDGQEGHRIGLVNQLSDPETLVDDAVAYAQELAEHCSPWSMAAIKAQVEASLDLGLQAAINQADDYMVQSLLGPDVAEGVSSYLEGRPPAFPPLSTRS